MNIAKQFFIAFILYSMTVPVFAGNQLIDSLIGAAAGGGAARAICHNCNTRNRNIATAAGALGGAWVGSNIGDSSNHRRQQQFQPTQTYGDAYRESVRQVVPVETTYVREETPTRVAESTRVVRRDRDCDEEYYHGQYNPELAHAYCEGRRARLRQMQEAYSEGYASQ